MYRSINAIELCMIGFLMFHSRSIYYGTCIIIKYFNYQKINDIFFYIIADYIGGDYTQITKWVVFLQCYIFISLSGN